MDRSTLGPSPGAERAPDHRIEITDAPGRWKVAVDGMRVADSTGVLALDETGYDRALYFPPEDVATEKLAASDTRTTCPFKGEARYYARDGEDVAWTYPAVYDEVAPIAGYIAFYPRHAEIEEM